jgi:hypothetical protein
MKTRNSAWYALGLAAAITLGSAFEASAQATRPPARRRATSTKRIPVKKEVPAPVAAKTDTVTITRVDTVTVRRVDTVSTTVMRYDTVTRMVYPPLQRLPGVFFGLGAGANIPMNDIRGVFKDSWALQGQAGFFPGTSPLGLRVDGTFGKISHRQIDCPGCNDPSVWTLGADAILRMPLDRTSKLNPVLYVFGGGGWSHFGDISKGTTPRTRQLVGPYDTNPTHFIDVSGGHGYWDVGPGVDFSLGGLHLYAEGRYMTIMTSGKNSHMFPVYGGLKFY